VVTSLPAAQLNYSAISSKPPLQNLTKLIAPTVLVIASWHGLHREHHSIVGFMSFAAGKCLPSCCPETGCVIPLRICCRSNGRYFATVTQQRLHCLTSLGVVQLFELFIITNIITSNPIRTEQKTPLPTVPVLLCVYSLPRTRVYRTVA
jgi:hypothetical protein